MRSLERARERGATSLEYAGFVAVAALVVAAIFLGIAGGSNPLARGVTGALCKLFTLGQGGCEVPGSADSRIPPEPCVISAQGHESNIKAGVAIMGGGGERWLVEELSDGTFRVTRGTSASLGLEGGAGFSVTGSWEDRTYGVEAGASASVDGVFTAGEVYNLPSLAAVDEMLFAHYADIAKDQTVGGQTFGIPFTDVEVTNPIRWATDQVTDLAGMPSLPEADETYYEGGVSADAAASATWLMANAQASVGVQGVMGVREGSNGETTTYYAATFDGSIGAGTWGGASDGSTVYAEATAGGKVDGAIEVRRDGDGNVTAVTVRFGGQGDAYAGEQNEDEGARWEMTAELPVTDSQSRAVASDFLNAMNMGPVPGLPGYVPNPMAGPSAAGAVTLVPATLAFQEALTERGYLSRQTFSHDEDDYGANFDAAWIAKVGGSLEVSTTTATSQSAEYFNGQGWTPWEGCAA